MPFSRYKPLLASAFALLLIVLALVIPNRIGAFNFSSVVYFPFEILVIGLLLLLPGRAGWVLRWMLALVLAAGVILKFADMATYNVFSRPFNPVVDSYLFINGMQLLNGTIGKLGASLVMVLLVLVVLAILVAAFWVLGRAQRLMQASIISSAVVLTAGLALWSLLFFVESPRASLQFYHHLNAHVKQVQLTLADVQLFRAQLEQDTTVLPASENLFASLHGKDVLVIFVESYGRTVLDKPEFSTHIRPLLERTSSELASHGFIARSGFLTSPTVGGLSWLAHGSVLSGLWIDNEKRYKSLMISERPTLNRLFNQAGWRTVAVMPAITMAWPEGQYYGYDQIYDAYNLGYQGKPFNWVTMPDQYTLAAFHARELSKKARPPVMAEIALISSHAPWTPIPEMLDWSLVGDGSVFNAQALSGDSPEIVWKDNARIRLQFRLAIEYALQNLGSYITHYGNDDLVVLVIGDHQPAPLVTGETDNRDVPVHLITRDAKVIEAIEHWQWTAGMLPADDAPVWRMDKMRNKFIDVFSVPQD